MAGDGYPSASWFAEVGLPEGDRLACRTVCHDVCVVTGDGRHHTYNRSFPDRGIVVQGGEASDAD